MNGTKFEFGTPDDLDAALDRLVLSSRSGGEPDWVSTVQVRLHELDQAFAPGAEGRSSIGRFDASAAGPRAVLSVLSPHTSRSRFASTHVIAAALAIILVGMLTMAGFRGELFSRDQRPYGAHIAAVGTPSETVAVSDLLVTPTSCTFQPLTRERYDEIVGTATPLSEENIGDLLAARTAAVRDSLGLKVVSGAVTITGGEMVSDAIAGEIGASLATFMACVNANNGYAAAEFLSDEFLRLISDPDQFFADLESYVEAEGPPLEVLQFEEVRQLPDGRVVAVWTNSLQGSSDSFEYNPEPTPVGTIAIQGILMVFVETPDGWRLDFQRSGDSLRIPLSEDAGTAEAG